RRPTQRSDRPSDQWSPTSAPTDHWAPTTAPTDHWSPTADPADHWPQATTSGRPRGRRGRRWTVTPAADPLRWVAWATSGRWWAGVWGMGYGPTCLGPVGPLPVPAQAVRELPSTHFTVLVDSVRRLAAAT